MNKSFWRRDFVRRRSWFDAHVKIIEPVRRTVPDTITEPGAKAKRTRTLEYYLPANKDTGLKLRVCKSACLSTLGLKTDGRVTEFDIKQHQVALPLLIIEEVGFAKRFILS